MSTRYRTKKSLEAVNSISHECLRNASFFKGRNPEFLEKISEYLQLEIFSAGEDILTMGATGDKMYFLHRGEVEVLVGPELKSVAKLGSGNIFGEMALFGSQRRTATVRALEFCDCRAIHHIHFQSLLKMFPEEHSYFEKLYEERTLELQKVQQQAQLERRRRSSSRWLASMFSEDTLKDGVVGNLVDETLNSNTRPEKVVQRRHSISGVLKARSGATFLRRGSSANSKRDRHYSISSCADHVETMLSTLRGQSNRHDSPEEENTLVPRVDDIALLDRLDDQDTKSRSSDDNSSSGPPSSHASKSNSPQVHLPDIATRMRGQLEALRSTPEAAAGLQSEKVQKEESDDEWGGEALAESAQGLMDADLPASTAFGGKTASDTESGSCSPARKKFKVRPPLMSTATSLPSPGIVRRLGNIKRARTKTLSESQEGEQDVGTDLQGVLPVNTRGMPMRRAKTLDEGVFTNTQCSSSNSWRVRGMSVLDPRSSQSLRDKMKHDTPSCAKASSS